jgi:hypothetical protein
MISGKLVHLIESHEEEIISRVDEQIRHVPELAHIRAVLGNGLHQLHRELLESLSRWLSQKDDEKIALRHEHVGRELRDQGIALHECVRDLCLVRETLVDYVEEHTFNKDNVELYAEEELDRKVGRFVDVVMIQMVRSYELERPHAAVA